MSAPVSVSADRPPEGMPTAGRAAVRGGVVGNYVDQLNIFLPVVALAPALPTLGGPHVAASAGAVVVVATLLGRPLGSMIFGRISDRAGRTTTTQVAIAGTAGCSLAIAAVPTHAQVGAAAIWLVVLLRLLGGIFLAGEYTSAIPLAMEWSRPRGRGLLSGLVMAMAPCAQATIALTTVGLIAALGPEGYAAWGWRISFAVGGLASLGLLAYYRAHVADAPDRGDLGRRLPGARPAGLREVLRGSYAGAFWQTFGLMTGLWLMTNMVVILLPRHLAELGHDAREVAMIAGGAAVAQALGMVLTGMASTRLGRRRFFVGWGLSAAVAGPLLWVAVSSGGAGARLLLTAAALQVLTVCGYGPVGAYLSERFPMHVRATAYGTAYSLSIVGPALFPWWLPPLQRAVGEGTAVVAVVALGGLLVAAMAARGPRLAPEELDAPVEELAQRSAGRAAVPA